VLLKVALGLDKLIFLWYNYIYKSFCRELNIFRRTYHLPSLKNILSFSGEKSRLSSFSGKNLSFLGGKI
jgi:hypothetical protein